ncbi:lytic transglycosylase domain-containing protein [Rossellomorea aquimaris]|uniref:lytic transglycosylase domain-containing protein n=1 Tax=Rossellomorea aquimaris TaxID=189382 RepID=UPI0007D09632|nr:lytic transglycosylase domain-containing protein [Rossellomorea aquimaris]
MNVQQLKTIMEIQALGSLGSISSAQNSSNQSTDMFQQLLNQALLSTNKPSFSANALGAVKEMIESQLPLTASAQNKVPPLPTVNNKEWHSPQSIDSIISRAADTFKLPKKLIQSVIKQESNFNPNAVSHAGASGLMQLMPSTARGLGVTNIFDPEENVFAGAKYLKQMLDKYNGDIHLALAAYNAGPGNVDKYNGIPPFKETTNYVKKVTTSYFA